jgi:hypothetical protein
VLVDRSISDGDVLGMSLSLGKVVGGIGAELVFVGFPFMVVGMCDTCSCQGSTEGGELGLTLRLGKEVVSTGDSVIGTGLLVKGTPVMLPTGAGVGEIIGALVIIEVVGALVILSTGEIVEEIAGAVVKDAAGAKV